MSGDQQLKLEPQLSDHSIRTILSRDDSVKEDSRYALSAVHPRARRRPRTTFPRKTLVFLEESFTRDPYPGITEREDLARQLGVSETRIHVWFQNKRSRSKRKTADRGVVAKSVDELSRMLTTDTSDRRVTEQPIENQDPRVHMNVNNMPTPHSFYPWPNVWCADVHHLLLLRHRQYMQSIRDYLQPITLLNNIKSYSE